MSFQRLSHSSTGFRVSAAGSPRPSPATHGSKVESNFGGVPTQFAATGMQDNQTMMGGGLVSENEESLIPHYRSIYYHDSVGGATVDITTSFPFSEWTLTGLDKRDVTIYSDALSRLDLKALMPTVAYNYLVDGAFIGSLVYEPEDKVFQDILIHDRLACSISPKIFHAQNPIITARTASVLSQFMNSGSPYVDEVMKTYPPAVMDTFMRGDVVLDPLTTLYFPRQTLGQHQPTTSYLKRLLPMYFLEKTLYRGTIVEATKRQRAMNLVTVGTDTWEPTPQELKGVLDRMQMAEMDPLGAWVVTRQGVQLQQGPIAGDFWKWNDVLDSFIPHKLRALGVSEAFLSGEACLSGSTLIPTSNGLMRIDAMGDGTRVKNVQVPIKHVVDSRYGNGVSTSWIYNGYRDVIEVKTERGNAIRATTNHQVLTFNADSAEHLWKRVDRLNVGDVLCVSRNEMTRSKPLKLNIPIPAPRTRVEYDPERLDKDGKRRGVMPGSRNEPWIAGDMVAPPVMTTKLAYWMALFISEGSTAGADRYVQEKNVVRRFGFGNTDSRLVRRFSSLAKELFDVDSSDIACRTAAQINESASPHSRANGFVANKDFFETYIRNRRLVDWLTTAGVYMAPGRVGGKTPSYFKRVPWSILQADAASQRAFLAAYAECDGTTRFRETCWFSVSEDILTGIAAMLNALGYQPKRTAKSVTLFLEDSEHFWAGSAKYLSEKEVDTTRGESSYSKLDGLPIQYWLNLVESRKRGFNRHGQFYLTDTGSTVQLSKNRGASTVAHAVFDWGFSGDIKRLNYSRWDAGQYQGFVHFLREISPEAAVKLETMMHSRQRYVYTEVVSLTAAGKDHVYDLCMRPGTEPAFVANGLVVHNSFSTAEVAMSVFTENIAAFRNALTNAIFYQKLFPLVAVTRGMYKDPSTVSKVKGLAGLMRNLNNTANLRVPKLHWHKNLDNHDPTVMDMLEKLGDHGLPVPLRMWAAAANVNLEMLLGNLEEDTAIRDTISRITGVRPDDAGGLNPDLEEGGGMDELSALREQSEIRSYKDPVMNRAKSLLQRDFTSGHRGDTLTASVSKSGRVMHSRPDASSARSRAHFNDMIYKATKSLADPHRREQVKQSIIAKKGRVPNVLG